ncbi:MAG TPA: hypothetical protein VFZ65_10050, partial [Planctomycetota bacterium]|nr:hypothetical protein [Planctomycetota bacterium]
RWAALPRNAHVCECAVNHVANIDGLRALHRGDEDEAVRCLKAAVSVNGCPHLNSGAASLGLAEALLAAGVRVPDIVEHLHAVEQYCVTDATARLRTRLAQRDDQGSGPWTVDPR